MATPAIPPAQGTTIVIPPGMTASQYFEKLIAEQNKAASIQPPSSSILVTSVVSAAAPPKPDIPIPIPPQSLVQAVSPSQDVVPPAAAPPTAATAPPAVPAASAPPTSFDRLVKDLEELTPPERLFAGMSCELLQRHLLHLYHEVKRLGQENVLLLKAKTDLEAYNLDLQTKLLQLYKDSTGIERRAAEIDANWSAKKRKECEAGTAPPAKQ